MRSVDSLLVSKGMRRGSSSSSLDLETLESDVSSGKSADAMAKDRGWPSISVRQPSSEEIQLHVMSVVLKGEFIEKEHGWISVKIVSHRKCLPNSTEKHRKHFMVRIDEKVR